MNILRPYQAHAIDQIRDALRLRHKRVVLQCPTGAGKTVIASEIIRMARDKGNRVIFTAPAIELIDQTARAFYDHGVRDIGILQANHPLTDPSKPVQIASIQTLARRAIPESALVLIDECHRLSQFTTKWLGSDEWAGVPFIGLSATPWARGMGRLWDKLIIGSTTKQMIEDGWLSPFRVYAPSHPNLEGVGVVAGDYHEGQLSAAMRKGTLTADIVSTWLRKAEGRPTLLFAVDRAHARHLTDEFARFGVDVGYIDGDTPKAERESIRRAFHNGLLKVVCNVGVLTTGIDWDVRCISYCRPTKSEILYVQIIGRGLRKADGKSDLLILDHSDTTLKLGFVTDIHHERLSMGRLEDSKVREIKPKSPRECSVCSALMPSGTNVCPECGHEMKPPRRSPDVQSGELVELSSKASAKRNREATMADKAKFYAELCLYATEMGYQPGWAAHKFKEFYSVWPKGCRGGHAKEVSMATRAWIRSRQIARAKSLAKPAPVERSL